MLDMGEPVKIADLARDMIHLSGLQQDDIKIVYTGLRPGEKLYEELLADDEISLTTPHPKLRIASARPVDEIWAESLVKWVSSTATLEDNIIRAGISQWLDEYTPDTKKSSSI